MMNTTAAFRSLALAVAFLAWVALVFVAISLGSGQTSPAQAQYVEERAVLIKEFECAAFLPPAPPLYTNEQTQSVITPSGTTKLTCQFEGEPIEETMIQTDFVCGTFLGLTTESNFVYTKSGQGTLTCHINPGG
jgi:hypothetical protein